MFSSKSSFGNQQNQFNELGRIAEIISERASIASKISLHVCALQKSHLFPPVPWKSCHQTLLAFKVRFPGDSQSLCQIPRLGSLTWGLEPSQWENLFGVIVLQPVGHPLGDYGIWFFRFNIYIFIQWYIQYNYNYIGMTVHAKLLQSCLTLCDSMDHSPPVSSVHGTFQARILEWVDMLSSRGASQPRDQTQASYVSFIGSCVLYH